VSGPVTSVARVDVQIFLKDPVYNVRAHDGEISASGFCCIIINFYVECGGMLWLEAHEHEAEWIPELVHTSWRTDKSLSLTGN